MLFHFSESILAQTKQESQKQDKFENQNDTSLARAWFSRMLFCGGEQRNAQ